MKKALKEGLLRRILPTFAILVIAMALVKPGWREMVVGLSIAIPLGLVLGFVIKRRIKAAGIVANSDTGAPVKVALEVRPGLLALGLGVCFALGYAVEAAVQRFDIEVGDYVVVIVVPLMLFALGLSLKPKRRGDGD